MRGPITWRNVDGVDFRQGNLIHSGVADIQSGLEGLQNILSTQARQQQQTWQQGKEANTINALNQINQLNSVDALNNTQASDLINPYGAQIDAQAVMNALKGQRGVIAKDMQTEDAINGYTEKAKYGPIADQAALLIQQGRTQEAAPLLEQLKGTSYAEKLGSMVQQLDWHNQDLRLKQRELDIQAARYAQDKASIDAANTESNMINSAAQRMQELVTNQGMMPNDAKNQVLKEYGGKSGTNIIKLAAALDGYGASFQPSEGTKNQLTGLQDKLQSVLASGKTQLERQQSALAQKTGYDPTIQAQWDKYNLEKNSFVVGEGDGQMPPKDKEKLDTELKLAGQPPLSTGETAWLVDNKQSPLLGFRNPYSLDAVIKQRKAKKAYDERNSVLTSDYSKWETETKKQIADQVRLAIGHDLAPNFYNAGGDAVDKATTMLNGRVDALNSVIGKTVGVVDENAQLQQQNKDLKAQRDAAVEQVAQSAKNKTVTENANAKYANPYANLLPLPDSNTISKNEEYYQERAARREWASNYKPSTPKDWDTVKQALATHIQQNDPYPTMKLRALNSAVDKAKNGDDSDFMRYFSGGLEDYASTLYDTQKASKK